MLVLTDACSPLTDHEDCKAGSCCCYCCYAQVNLQINNRTWVVPRARSSLTKGWSMLFFAFKQLA